MNPKIVKGEMFGLDCKPLPSLVVFDLDYCLWPFWCPPTDASTVEDATLIDLHSSSCLLFRKLAVSTIR